MTTGGSRPVHQPFAWQDKQWQVFQVLINKDKLPHAVLLSGPSETGKHHFALALAARMLCSSPIASQACLTCKACLLVKAGSHPDFFRVQPEDKGKAISVDAIRRLAGFSAGTAMLSGWRVILIDPVEAMTHNAANALLKTLEEPGQATLLILVHHQQGELLATIRSRCQSFLFPTPDHQQALEWLHDQVDVGDAQTVLEAAGGRPLRALRLVGDESFEQIKQLETLLASVADGFLSPVQAAEQWKSITPTDLIEWMLAAHTRAIANAGRKNALPGREYFLFLDQLLFAQKLLLSKANPNPQLLIEELLAGWRQLSATARS